LFFTEEIISDICKFTNQEIDWWTIKYSSNPSWCKPTTVAEIRGLIVILYLCAAKKDNHMDAQALWDPASGSDVYRSVMPFQRYRFLRECCRFDDKSMRNKDDPFVHIRGLWKCFLPTHIKIYFSSLQWKSTLFKFLSDNTVLCLCWVKVSPS
jgi:hypothetical protein